MFIIGRATGLPGAVYVQEDFRLGKNRLCILSLCLANSKFGKVSGFPSFSWGGSEFTVL